MTEAKRIFGIALQNSDTPLLGYIDNVDDTPMQQADIGESGSITRKVFDLDSATPLVETQSDELDATDVIFDELQPWDVDQIGHNIRDVVPGSYFPLAERRYEVQYRFITAAGATVYMKPFEIKTVRTF